MFSLRLLALVAFVGVCAADYQVVNVELGMRQPALEKLGYPGGLGIHLYAPNSSESFPLIWFTTGFGCNVPVSMYSNLLTKIASKGYIIAGLANPGHAPNYPKDGQFTYEIMEWGKKNLSALMKSQSLTAVPDVEHRSAIMAQSAGNHVAGQALTLGCSGVKAFVMIDPVDGLDPYRIIKSEDLIKPGEKVKFNVPALLLDNGLDPVKANILSPACAPSEVSNDHFYNAWQGPIWNINATAYGHIDCMDHQAVGNIVCKDNPKTDKEAYRAMLADATVTFLDALFQDKPDQLAALEDQSHWKVDVVLKHDLKGKSHSQVLPGCTNDASTPTVVV